MTATYRTLKVVEILLSVSGRSATQLLPQVWFSRSFFFVIWATNTGGPPPTVGPPPPNRCPSQLCLGTCQHFTVENGFPWYKLNQIDGWSPCYSKIDRWWEIIHALYQNSNLEVYALYPLFQSFSDTHFWRDILHSANMDLCHPVWPVQTNQKASEHRISLEVSSCCHKGSIRKTNRLIPHHLALAFSNVQGKQERQAAVDIRETRV